MGCEQSSTGAPPSSSVSRVRHGGYAPGSIKMHYWGVKSRAHYALYVAAGANQMEAIEWNKDHPYPGTPAWDSHPIKSMNGSLPYLVDETTGAKLGQSLAMCRYFARVFDMYNGVSDADFAMSEQMIDFSEDFHSKLSAAHYAPDGNRTKAMDDMLVNKQHPKGIHRLLRSAEAQLSNSGFFTATLLPGDCVYAACLDIANDLEPGILKDYPKSDALRLRFELMEGVQKLKDLGMYEYFKRKSDPVEEVDMARTKQTARK